MAPFFGDLSPNLERRPQHLKGLVPMDLFSYLNLQVDFESRLQNNSPTLLEILKSPLIWEFKGELGTRQTKQSDWLFRSKFNSAEFPK